MSTVKRWSRVAAVNVLVLLALVAAAELLARQLCYEEFEALFPRREAGVPPGPFIERHPLRGLALIPGYEDDRYRVNSAGFRGEELPEDLAQRFVILALGDSTTFGWEVAEGEDYPRRLQEILAAEGFPRVHVVNAGIPSFTSRQALLYLREILDGGLEPDLVVLSILWNDIWFSSMKNWHPNLLVHQAPPAWRRWLLESSGLYRCALIVGGTDTDPVNVFNEPAFEAYLSNVEEHLLLARQRGIPLVLMDPPLDGAHLPRDGLSRFYVTYTKEYFIELGRRHLAALESLAERYGAPIVRQRLSIEDLDQFDLFLDALHPNPRGNDLMARDVASFLIDAGYCCPPSLPSRGRYLESVGQPETPP